jgi:hypothetical protein
MEHCIEQHPVRMPFDQLNAHRYFAQTGQFAETGYSYQFLFLVKLKALLIIAVGRYCMASANYVLPRVAMHLVIYKTKQVSLFLMSILQAPSFLFMQIVTVRLPTPRTYGVPCLALLWGQSIIIVILSL